MPRGTLSAPSHAAITDLLPAPTTAATSDWGKVVFRSESLEPSDQRHVQGAIAMLLWKCRLRAKPLAWQRDHDDEFPPRFIGIEFKIRHLGVSARMGMHASTTTQGSHTRSTVTSVLRASLVADRIAASKPFQRQRACRGHEKQHQGDRDGWNRGLGLAQARWRSRAYTAAR
jgi:hypothetical protein